MERPSAGKRTICRSTAIHSAVSFDHLSTHVYVGKVYAEKTVYHGSGQTQERYRGSMLYPTM